MIYKSNCLMCILVIALTLQKMSVHLKEPLKNFLSEITFTINHKAARREAKFPNTSVAQILIYSCFGRLYNIHENVAVSEG